MAHWLISRFKNIKLRNFKIFAGTTFSAAAIFKNDMTEILPNGRGDRITPSCVAFTDKDRLIGKTATHIAVDNPENTIFGEL